MTNNEKKNYRSDLFRHLDGLVVAPVAYSLYKKGVCKYLLAEKVVDLAQITTHFEANEGYMNVALRVLASQGWLDYQVDGHQIQVSINRNTAGAFALFDRYKGVVELMHFSQKFHPRKFEEQPFQKLAKLFQEFKDRMGFDEEALKDRDGIEFQIFKHIEGQLVGPTIVHLGMGGMFHKYFMQASFTPDEYHTHPESFEVILDFLKDIGWFAKSDGHYSFTEKGIFFAKRASAYGVTVSYIPMFRMIDDLLFGDAGILWKVPPGMPEIHVDREMNVWGSGGAHSSYFKKIDEMIIHIFNQPLESQPKGIVDMGCGNGAFLIHLFDVIEKNTLRGRNLEEYPLFLVGADFNTAALKVTRANLIQADVWAKVLWGDISDPESLNKDLQDKFNIALHELLSVRTFLDHNRIWANPTESKPIASSYDGAFAYRGQHLSNQVVMDNLREHFLQWKPFINKYGLIVIELHTISPSLTSANLGLTAATAYDATHGFSDQYIVSIEAFLEVIGSIGLESSSKYFSKFPNSPLATVSIHFLI